MIDVDDCLHFMRSLDDQCMDMTFADPPFNVGKRYNTYQDKQTDEAYLEWSKEWITELVRITKDSGAILIHNIPRWLVHYTGILNPIATFQHWIAWDSMGQPLGKTLIHAHSGILYYTKSSNFKFYEIRYPHSRCRECSALVKDYGGKKKQLHSFGPLLSDMWTDIHRIRHASQRSDHPCQLPVEILERLILMVTDKDDTVFDPFMGTGTTAIAAKRLDRKFVGVDIDAKYVKIANTKLEQTTSTENPSISSTGLDIRTVRHADWQTDTPVADNRQKLLFPPSGDTK